MRISLKACLAAGVACGGVALCPAVRAADTQAATVEAEAPRITTTIDDSQRVAIPGTHRVLDASAVSGLAQLPGDARLTHLRVLLRPSAARQAALGALIAAQHDPASPQFHQWLSPGQFGASYGAVQADIATLATWLGKQGLSVNFVYPNAMMIDVSGTAGQFSQAFGTEIATATVDGAPHVFNTADITVPSAIAGVVAGVIGLDDFNVQPLAAPGFVARYDAARRVFHALAPSPATATSGTSRGLVPGDMQVIYGLTALHKRGITGKGVTIAVVENQGGIVPQDWTRFVTLFGLASYGGTFSQIEPPAPDGSNSCAEPAPTPQTELTETVIDSEWATAMAPSAHILVANCANGAFTAATNLVNASSGRPDIISASYITPEYLAEPARKMEVDAIWAQADAEGISVFVAAGDSGSDAGFNGSVINGNAGATTVSANGLASSPDVTGVGGNDLSDIYDHTTALYFNPSAPPTAGSALSYVPEIPWDRSCANPLGARYLGFPNVMSYCREQAKLDVAGALVTSEGGSGAPSVFDAKPAWQAQVFGVPDDHARDVPDVSLFAGAFQRTTAAVICTATSDCNADLSGDVRLDGGTSLAAPMFAGIQALLDQSAAQSGFALDQGNAAPELYRLAAARYGSPQAPNPIGLIACNAGFARLTDARCAFHNITRGSTVGNCVYPVNAAAAGWTTKGCAAYATTYYGQDRLGLTTTDVSTVPDHIDPANAAYTPQPGWSFTSGLGSVDAAVLEGLWLRDLAHGRS